MPDDAAVFQKLIWNTVMIEEKIKIKCSKCTAIFRERGTRLRNGHQLNCPGCNKLITIDSSSEDPNIRKALRAVRFVRHALEDEAAMKRSATAKLASALVTSQPSAPSRRGHP